MQVEHAYADSGSYIVQVTATDKDGGVSEVVSHNIAITAAALEDDPSDPGKTALVVGGTSGSDLIRFRPVHRSGAVEVFINHASQGTFTPTGRIIAYGGAGNDNIQVSDRIHLPAFLYGGPGNDFLLGGAGNNVLVGDDGNDILIGRGGRDVLIGGTGRDILIAGGGQDILIAGNTAFDSHDAALFLILSEWTSSRDYETRVANLRGEGNGPRANGDVFLKVGPNATVFDDGARDVLIGNRGRDWFFANLNSGVKDKIRHHLLGEFVDDPDFADAGI
ncbi:MAG: hypothetical protein HY040_04535 [Planctomycetes bacterium]|nr:hypothetical protein [Planctomycetota bacterium]